MVSADSDGRRGSDGYPFVLVANRLPVDLVDPDASGASEGWRRSPGGLVTALEPVMQRAGGVWVGWSGSAGDAPEPFDVDGLHLVAVPLSAEEVEDSYEGFANATLWPLYHDVIVAPQFHRRWWDAYVRVNERFAATAADHAGRGATVWVHDYQLQLVPGMLRRLRPDLRIGFFSHIPFPGYEIYAQLPWRRQIVDGLLGADVVGLQRRADVTNFLRACRRAAQLTTKAGAVHLPGAADTQTRDVRAAAFPISIDSAGLENLARSTNVRARAERIRADLGNPSTVLLGVDRLDYTKGIRHRLKAYEELLADKAIAPPEVTLMQVSTPSRERVDAYRHLREEIERTVGAINGEYSDIGSPAVYYLYQTYPKSEMAAMFLAADVMLVTPLRDGMNLIAKEYVASRHDLGGALVLSEFTGAWDELHQAFICNPHDVEGVKQTIMRAITAPEDERRRRMKALRKRVSVHDVQRWATRYLEALASAPAKPHRPTRASEKERLDVERANRSNLRASDNASEQTGEQ